MKCSLKCVCSPMHNMVLDTTFILVLCPLMKDKPNHVVCIQEGLIYE